MPSLPNTRAELARTIDHTLLKPEATREQVAKLCDECLQYGFAAACVNPFWAIECAERLRASDTAVATVAGFPLGATTPECKAMEARVAVAAGAGEVDMVVNLGALIAGDMKTVEADIATVVQAAKSASDAAIVKVILETRALTDEQIIAGCRCAAVGGADYVKTSTGFHPAGGATVEHVALLRKHAGNMKVKAAGGIRDLQTARAMLEAGADRLGMSASAAVISELQE